MIEPTVRSLMTTDVQTTKVSERTISALTRMAKRSISCLIVVEDSRPVGIFTERDAVTLLANSSQKLGSTPIRNVMTWPVHCIRQDYTLAEAANMMRAVKCRRFPVVNAKGQLVGLVTQTDIMNGTVRTLEKYSKGLERMVRQRTEELRRKNQELEAISITDQLTGLSNRRYLYRRFTEEMSRARRQDVALGCVMLDIDDFKLVNDRFGHDIGDTVLKEMGTLLQRTVRKEDIVARYGGDEFVILGQGDEGGLRTAAERVRESVESFTFVARQTSIRLTVSCGVAAAHPSSGMDEADELLRCADSALYLAKANGRNRTEILEQAASKAA